MVIYRFHKVTVIFSKPIFETFWRNLTKIDFASKTGPIQKKSAELIAELHRRRRAEQILGSLGVTLSIGFLERELCISETKILWFPTFRY